MPGVGLELTLGGSPGWGQGQEEYFKSHEYINYFLKINSQKNGSKKIRHRSYLKELTGHLSVSIQIHTWKDLLWLYLMMPWNKNPCFKQKMKSPDPVEDLGPVISHLACSSQVTPMCLNITKPPQEQGPSSQASSKLPWSAYL